MADPWFTYPICVPFGNPNYDAALGGSHDMDLACPPNYPVTALLAGTVSDSSSPSWGRQVCLRLDTPYRDIPYMAYLHLSAVNPSLQPGSHVAVGELIGWVGGATDHSQYEGTSNPTGENFLNDPSMSSRVQIGVALMRGPVYGGEGWEKFPPIDKSLDPTAIIIDACLSYWKEEQFHTVWHSAPWAWDSGICKTVKAAVMAGKISPCYPVDSEQRTIDDKTGASIQWQALSNGLHVKWDNHTGACHIFDAYNHQVV